MDSSPDIQPSSNTASPSCPIERRLVMRVLRYWRDVADERDMPARHDIDFIAIPDIAPFAWTVAVRRGADQPSFDYIGSSFSGEEADTLRGQPIAAAPAATLLAAATAYCRDVLARRVPISIGAQLTHRDGRVLLYRSIILPLSSDGDSIDFLLGAANCRPVS